RDLPCDHWRGPASSPYLWQDLLFLNMDGADVQYVVALDKTTGANRWVTFRSVDFGDLEEDGRPRASGDFRKAYNTPLVVDFQGEPQLISPGAKGAYGYDPRTGREIWQIRHTGHSSAPRTLYADGQVGIATGHIGGTAQLWAVRLGGRGDVTGSHVAWKHARGAPKRSSPVLVEGRVYMVSNDGIATCIDFKSGEEIWKERIGGLHSSSVLYASRRIHFFDEDGVATIIQPGDALEILARNKLDDGFMASPAVSDGALFLRTKTHLYRIQE
ncbi:MAG: PQQ-binding-like beta-propeller repeat protein, partial [Candidatus Aminicenantes bacterium]|nr:PQQ-binding-like beta-propeller repeat protein [Candidatus Aminicenantes bacterium]